MGGYVMNLFKVIDENNIKLVKKLIAAGANINEKDNDGYTALHLASWNGHLEIVKELIAAGANVDNIDNSYDNKYRFKDKLDELGETKFKIWVNML